MAHLDPKTIDSLHFHIFFPFLICIVQVYFHFIFMFHSHVHFAFRLHHSFFIYMRCPFTILSLPIFHLVMFHFHLHLYSYPFHPFLLFEWTTICFHLHLFSFPFMSAFIPRVCFICIHFPLLSRLLICFLHSIPTPNYLYSYWIIIFAYHRHSFHICVDSTCTLFCSILFCISFSL